MENMQCETRSVVLEKIKLTIAKEVSEELLGVRVIEDNFISAYGANIRLQVVGYLLGHQKYKSDTVRYPADWVQAIKERFAPAWILKRFPMNYRVIKMDLDVVYRDLRIANHEPTLVWHEQNYTSKYDA